MRTMAEGISEMEGVVTAAAHLFAALVTELPESKRAILRQSIDRWASEQLPDTAAIRDLTREQVIAILEPYDKGYVEFCRLVLNLSNPSASELPPPNDPEPLPSEAQPDAEHGHSELPAGPHPRPPPR